MTPARSTPRPVRLGIASVYAGLVVAIALAAPSPAPAQARDGGEVPSELWRTYPLDPSEGSARLQPGTEGTPQPGQQPPATVPPQPSPAPSPAETGTSRGTGARDAERPPNVGAPNSGADDVLTLVALGVLGLLLVLFVLVPTARMAAGAPASLGRRVGATLASPVRAVASAPRPSRPRPRLRPRGTRATSVRPRAARPPRQRPLRRPVVARPSRQPGKLSSSASAYGGRLVAFPRRVGRRAGRLGSRAAGYGGRLVALPRAVGRRAGRLGSRAAGYGGRLVALPRAVGSRAGRLGSRAAAYGVRLFALPRALGRGIGGAVGAGAYVLRVVAARRGVIALYTLAVLASASVGVAIALFVGG